MILASLAIVAATAAGWSDINVQPARSARPHANYGLLASLDRPSDRTMETLKRYDLARTYRHNVDLTLASLKKLARQTPNSELVFALAELSWIEARRLDRWRKANAIDRYLDAVSYASDFLFDPQLADPQRIADPRFQLARDLYNGGLEHLIRAAQSNGRIEPDATIKIQVHGREHVLRIALKDSPWTAGDVDKIILCSDLEVTGLSKSRDQYGLGVPLIGVRMTEQTGKGDDRFYPPEMAFPLTAFLVPNSRLHDANADPDAPRECSLMLIDPVRTRSVGPAATAMPVESDLTTPLAYMWSKTDLNRYRWTGLLRPGEALGRANLILIRPFEPKKIPVVMVHGLISSPLAWIPMLDELLRDPVIQQRYQFMLYMYPTGVPVPIAAAGLRESLREAERMYDPDGRDPEFEKMVLIGHSMGGLLSHAMAVDSGDQFWRINSDRRFEEINGPPETLATLKRFMFFKPLPFVRRVVFLATPHRGSEFSRGVVGRVGSSLISEPDTITELLSTLLKENPDAFNQRKFRRMPTSIETLETNSEILQNLLAMQPAPGVFFHSVIGSTRPDGVDKTTDGVVPYRSAHIEGVASELIVRSDHSVQKNPRAILEVRRILWEHIGQAQSPVAQAPESPQAVR